MFLFLWIATQSGLWFSQPDGEIFSGRTQIVLETDQDEDDILGLELFIGGKSAVYTDKLPFEFFIDFNEYPSGGLKIRAVLTRFSGSDLVAEKSIKNVPAQFDERVNYVSIPLLVEGPKAERELKLPDLQLKEEGRTQKISDVLTTERPIHVVILFDASGSMEGRLFFVRKGVSDFLDTLRPQDKAQIIGFNAETFLISDWDDDKEAIKERMLPLRPGGDTNLYGAIWTGVAAASKIEGRRAVLLFTDGHQEVNIVPENYLEKSLDEGVLLAQSHGVPVYTIGVGPAIVPEELQAVADETGGKAYVLRNRKSVLEAFGNIGQQLGRQYLVCYYSSSSRSGWHDVVLETHLKNLQLHYPKKVYFR